MKALIDAVMSGAVYQEPYKSWVKVVKHPQFPDLAIVNYVDGCPIWDEVTRWARGFILNTQTGEVVALPFGKFWNVGERNETKVESLPKGGFRAFEKLDGSMGILYRTYNGKALATRGAFDSQQAKKGTQMLLALKGVDLVPEELTFIFEIIARETQGQVFQYEGERLVLLAVMNRVTGEELDWDEVVVWAERLGCDLPQVYEFDSVEEMLVARKDLPMDFEGWVIRFENGLRVKLKGDAYLKELMLARLLSRAKALDWLKRGTFEAEVKTLAERAQLRQEEGQDVLVTPAEILARAEILKVEIAGVAEELKKLATEAFTSRPAETDPKAYAKWVQTQPKKIQSALFKLSKGETVDWFDLAVKVGVEK